MSPARTEMSLCAAATSPDGILQRLRTHLFAGLDRGTPKLSQVAKELAFGPRTLQRYLRQLDTSFAELLEAVRQERYVTLATSGTRSQEDLARALGYSDARSLRRWRRRVSRRRRKQRDGTSSAFRGTARRS